MVCYMDGGRMDGLLYGGQMDRWMDERQGYMNK